MKHSKHEPLPSKPHPDFPLFPHATHRWAKKIRGKFEYFGSTNGDPEGKAALANYHDQIAGRPSQAQGLTVAGLCNRFLTVSTAKMEAGKLVPRTFKNYKQATDILVAHFGKLKPVENLTVEDFEGLMTAIEKEPTEGELKRRKRRKKRGPSAVGNLVQVIRIVFNYGYANELLDKPVRFGTTFKRPARKVMRKVRAAKGSQMLEAAEIRKLLESADVQMRAMILLGANCGFGNADCGQLPIAAVQGDCVVFPRPKTGIDRRCPLWPETAEAVRIAIEKRPLPKDTADVGKVFITKYGQPWFRPDTTANPVTAEFKKLLNDLGLYRPGLGFYSLRRGFETIGGETGDQVAVDFIMGHADDARDMSAVYRQRISDDRLEAVVNHVHAWLFPPKSKKVAKRKATTRVK